MTTSPRWRWTACPLHRAVTNISVRWLTSTLDPSARRSVACAPGPVRIPSASPMAAPASSAPPFRRYSAPLADTTVARAPPGAIHASMVSRPRYTTDKSSAAAAARVPQRRQPEDDRCGIAITRRSPLISASAARHAVQRLMWSSTSTRLPPVRPPLRYARRSGRNSVQPATAISVTFFQTRARTASSVAALTASCFICCSASSSRSSVIADLLRLTLHFRLQPQPDSMETDGNVVLLELELVRQLLIREPLDVAQEEQGRVFPVEGRNGAAELLFQQQRRFHGGM